MPGSDPTSSFDQPTQTVRLGLIGDNIARSQSPRLHKTAGRLCGLAVTYDRLVPAELGEEFDSVFKHCRESGYRGLNITYPYKERVMSRLVVDDPLVRAMAACNTVLFDAPSPCGLNTDCSGFIDAFRHSFGETDPGVVAVAGAGGVGKAVSFALGCLGAPVLKLFDRDIGKAEALAGSLKAAFGGLKVEVAESIEQAASAADGILNCTPRGMAGLGGTAIPRAVLGSQRWAFDAVYTPVETPFVRHARAAGLLVMSGYELFFHQGVNAFEIFAGCRIDRDILRRELLQPENGERPSRGRGRALCGRREGPADQR